MTSKYYSRKQHISSPPYKACSGGSKYVCSHCHNRNVLLRYDPTHLFNSGANFRRHTAAVKLVVHECVSSPSLPKTASALRYYYCCCLRIYSRHVFSDFDDINTLTRQLVLYYTHAAAKHPVHYFGDAHKTRTDFPWEGQRGEICTGVYTERRQVSAWGGVLSWDGSRPGRSGRLPV